MTGSSRSLAPAQRTQGRRGPGSARSYLLLTYQWLVVCLLWPNAGHNRNGVGALRLRGRRGIVVRDVVGAIDVGPGRVRVEREEWPAESNDGTPITAGTWVVVTDVRGSRLVVAPLDGEPAGNGRSR